MYNPTLRPTIDDERTSPKGGSNLLFAALTDAEADEIWAARFAAAVSSIDDVNDEIVVTGDFASDYAVGDQLRIRGSSSNEGIYTVSAAASYDGSANETTVSVEESLTTESISGTVVLEPFWLAGGWHPVGRHLAGGTITREREVEREFDEADVEIAEVTNTDEVQIGNAVKENSERFYLLLEWGEDNYFPCRYFLPMTSSGQFKQVGDDLYADGRFFPRASFQKDSYEESTARDQQRSHPFTIAATPPSVGQSPVLRKVVNLTQQDGWATPEPDVSAFTDAQYTTTRQMPA